MEKLASFVQTGHSVGPGPVPPAPPDIVEPPVELVVPPPLPGICVLPPAPPEPAPPSVASPMKSPPLHPERKIEAKPVSVHRDKFIVSSCALYGTTGFF
jgi:hypothetical protein